MDRRSYLKAVGATGIAAAAVGISTLNVGADATAQLSIDDGDAGAVTNDTGNLSEVFVKPKMHVSWDGFDESVDKLRILVEARLERNEQGDVLPAWQNEVGTLRQNIYDALGHDYGEYPLLKDGYVPVFRETPWLFNDEYYPEVLTSAGTSGSYPTDGYAPVFSRASELTERSDDYFKRSSLPESEIPPIVLFSDDHPRPEYEGLPTNNENVTEDAGQYLSGISLSGGGNFLNGSYGAAGDTSLLDNDEDDKTKTRRIGLRFTVSLRHDAADVNADPLTMSGEDGLPAHDADGDPAHSWAQYNRGYAGLQSIADQHPAVMVDTSQVVVDVTNEAAAATGTGSLNADAN